MLIKATLLIETEKKEKREKKRRDERKKIEKKISNEHVGARYKTRQA